MTIRMVTTALLLVISLGWAGGAAADDEPDRKALAQQALERLEPVRTDGELLVNWRGNRPTPVRVAGFKWQAPEGVAGADIARAFIMAHPELVRVGTESLKLQATKASRDRVAYRFAQTWHELDVLGGELIVLTDASGTVISLADQTFPVSLEEVSSIAADKAVDAAWTAVLGSKASEVGAERTIANGMARKVVLARGGSARLAYRVVVPTIPLLEKWVVLVDAATGTVIQKTNEVIR